MLVCAMGTSSVHQQEQGKDRMQQCRAMVARTPAPALAHSCAQAEREFLSVRFIS